VAPSESVPVMSDGFPSIPPTSLNNDFAYSPKACKHSLVESGGRGRTAKYPIRRREWSVAQVEGSRHIVVTVGPSSGRSNAPHTANPTDSYLKRLAGLVDSR
jgi:hypothetical protein